MRREMGTGSDAPMGKLLRRYLGSDGSLPARTVLMATRQIGPLCLQLQKR